MHGYQIIRELSERSGGVWSPSPGSVYPTLQLLEDEGLVTSEQHDGKRVFSATEQGRTVAAERADEGRPAPWDEVASEADSSLVALRSLAIQLVVASRQVAHAGSASDVAKAKAVLTDARKAIYGILAESPGDDHEADGGGA
jgi:DNA-binding PadR family transcriptional regulator